MPTSWPSAAGAPSTSGRRSSPRSSGAAARWSSSGGPYPTLCPERFVDGTFDVVFDGETENTWPEFCQDLLKGSPLKPVYKQIGNIDMQKSPGAPLRPHPEGRLPLLLHPDDPGLPVRVRVLRHHRHRRPRPAAEVDPPGPQGDRDRSPPSAGSTSASPTRTSSGTRSSRSSSWRRIGGVRPEEQLSHPVLRRDDHHRRGEAAAARAPAGGELHQHLRGDRVAAHRQSDGVEEAAERPPAAARQRPADPVPQPHDRRRDDRRVRPRRPSDLRGAVRLPHGSRDPLHDLRGSDGDREDAAARPAPEGRTSPPVRLGDGARARRGRPQLHPEAHDGG